MPSLNTATIVGHLVADPEVRFSKSGNQLITFTVACNYKRGEYEEKLFLRCECWGDWHRIGSAQKGSAVMVSGRLKTNPWEDKDGKRRQDIALVCNLFECIQPKEF